jgi:putative membrane protein
MIRSILFATVLAAAILPAAAALSSPQAGQGPSPQQGQAGGATLSKSDRDFVDKAALGGLLEVKLGQLAQQKGESQDVRNFGKRMVDDHSSVNSRLEEIAGRKGLKLPRELDDKHRERVDKLSKKTGAEFDRDYIKRMVDDHQDDVDEFEKAARDAKDPELKSFASATLPTLREHLSLAKQIRDRQKK